MKMVVILLTLNLKRQHQSRHGRQLFSCAECKYKVRVKHALKEHQKRFHKMNNYDTAYNCKICKKKASNPWTLYKVTIELNMKV